MPATIVLQQTPNAVFDMAYGPNPITLTGITSNEDKYVLKVFVNGSATPTADIRQTPNKYGKAIFDLQNILQSYVSPPDKDIDSLGLGAGNANSMRNTSSCLISYTLSIGFELNGAVTIMPTGYGTYLAYSGSKQYYEVPFNTDYYQSAVAGDDSNPPCTVVTRTGHAFTDVKWLTGPADTNDTIQSLCTITQNIATRNVYRDDMTTVTWFQKLERLNGVNTKVRGIEAFLFYFMDSDGNVIGSPETVPNTTSYGGGPNGSIGDGLGVPNSLSAITVATGPYNTPGSFQVPLTCSHYYVIPVAYDPCSLSTPQLLKEDLLQAQRFNILDEKCNDFEHFQFSWYNSVGFKDYFTFTKRVDHSSTTNRNRYLKEAADYNSQSWSVDQESRGYTTYSSKIEDIYTVTSDFMNDDEAALLQTMFQSSEVKVRMADKDTNQWIPIDILGSTYDQKTNRKDKLFQYTVRFKLAHNIKSQRG